MHFTAIADTDIGISRETNQDSLLVKHASCDAGEILLAVACDGMGGLSKGELASSAVILEFSRWFDEALPLELRQLSLDRIGERWSGMLKTLNAKIRGYGEERKIRMGTTFTGILFVGQQYLIVHVGDCRIYHIDSSVQQLTKDQTFVAREVLRGTMTKEQARKDKRRNMLLQCIGASDEIAPEVSFGEAKEGAYLLCSDGFRHEIAEQEMFIHMEPRRLTDKGAMHSAVRALMEEVKRRGEKDNISVILIKADCGV